MSLVRKLVVVLVAVTAAACGSNGSSKSSTTKPTATSDASRASGPVTVFAAASLTDAFTDAKATLEQSSDLSVTYNFAGSQALVQQIQQGAPADVFAAADMKNMQKLVDAGLVQTPKTFARN